MSRFRPLLLVAALALAGCDTFMGTKCLLGRTGCHLPGKWRLVSVDGTSQTGSLDVSAGQWKRDGYGDLPTGIADTVRVTGPYSGNYVNEPSSPTRFQMRFTANKRVAGARYIELDGNVVMADDEDSFVYEVSSVHDDDALISTSQMNLPLLRRGVKLTFRRIGG